MHVNKSVKGQLLAVLQLNGTDSLGSCRRAKLQISCANITLLPGAHNFFNFTTKIWYRPKAVPYEA